MKRLYLTIICLAALPLAAQQPGGFVVVNGAAGTSRFTVVNGGTLTAPHNYLLNFVKSSDTLGVALFPIPDSGADWDVRIAFTSLQWGDSPECGLWWTDGTTAGSSVAVGLVVATSVEGTRGVSANILGRIYNPLNGGSAVLAPWGPALDAVARMGSLVAGKTWLRVTRSGTTFSYYLGNDYDAWVLLGTSMDSARTYTHVGFGCDPRGTNLTIMRVYEFTVQ